MSGAGSGAPRRVHQLLAALSYGDAISNEALAIQGHLRAAGFASDIFAEKVHPRMAHLARPLWQYEAESADAIRAAARRAGIPADVIVEVGQKIQPDGSLAPVV